jgi:glycosyltransferase involved in cell wall biosynthesis
VSTPFVKGWQNERHFRPVRVAPDFTPEAVADTLADAMSEDPSARVADGRAVAREFDWSAVAARVAEVYRQVLAGPTTAALSA